ncbi:MAG: hypothetical protein PHQ27_02195 [Victivallales bacterium]|nr:hypothetical protein [Victivallales bacterium]
MNRKRLFLPALGLMLSLSGCLGPTIHYSGKTYPSTHSVAILKSGIELPGYTEMGRCSISGDYQSCSFDQLIAQLRHKAAAVGADAIFIQNRTVVATGIAREDQLLDTSPDNPAPVDDDSSEHLAGINRDLSTVSNAFSPPEQQYDTPVYQRTIQAIFLKKNAH